MIPFIDLDAQHAPIRAEIDEAIAEVIDAGQFIQGPFVESFERQVADYVGVGHAVGVSSGSDALLASLMALDIGPGDEVITTPFTFCASAECILRVGATPVFVDIEPATFNMDVALIEEAICDKTRAIIAVHLYGQCSQMETICGLANRHDLWVIEDCAQAMGARYQGRQAGSMGDVGCFSFFPTKNLGGMGDAGMITCDDAKLAQKLRMVCAHGCAPKRHQRVIGGNFRLDTVQAAVLGVKLGHLDEWIDQRRANAARYDEVLAGVDGVVTPVEARECVHSYNQYTVRVGDRDAVCARLDEAGVGYGVYYRMGLHQMEAYGGARVGSDGLGETERACAEVVSLPVAGESVDAASRQIARLM